MADEQATNPADTPQADPPSDPSSNATIAALTRERDENYDRYVRKAAEFDNYRKRVERERREQADRAVVSLLEDILAIVDDFDLALTVDAGEGGTAYRKGVEMIHAKLQDLLRKQGVKPIEALGADFNPNLHEAVMQESSPGHRENEVIAVLRKGYTLNNRLLRAASVKVATA
ncbi:MAG: nucleotide exchange factor GrpE [Vicinamibacterales bacterium]